MSVIDRKFQIQAVNPVNGKRYDETNSLLLCAKDAAVPAALNAYYSECVRIGANHEHQESVLFLLDRVIDFQKTAGGGRTPDTIGAEIPRCLNGEGLDDPKPQGQWAIVEMFGHQRVAGLIKEVTFGGCNFVRVDVPQVGATPAFTKMLGQGAIYCINFVSEEIARGSAQYNRSVPVQSYELPKVAFSAADGEDWQG